MRYIFVYLLSLLVLLSASFSETRPARKRGDKTMFSITSPHFSNNGSLPKKYSCEGDNVNPDLHWGPTPAGTKSYLLIVDDPDAPTPQPWVHWILFNIPADVTELQERVDVASLQGAQQGKTSGNKLTYEGACPPRGHGTHHYHFKIYALDTMLALQNGANRPAVEQAMKGHVLAQAEIVATYERR